MTDDDLSDITPERLARARAAFRRAYDDAEARSSGDSPLLP